MSQSTLFDTITVHCFTCPHVEHGTTPEEAHDLMEGHYAEKHARQIARICAEVAL